MLCMAAQLLSAQKGSMGKYLDFGLSLNLSFIKCGPVFSHKSAFDRSEKLYTLLKIVHPSGLL